MADLTPNDWTGFLRWVFSDFWRWLGLVLALASLRGFIQLTFNQSRAQRYESSSSRVER